MKRSFAQLLALCAIAFLLIPTLSHAEESPKVTVCHKPGTPAEKELSLPESSIAGHLNHGDILGPCEQPPVTATVFSDKEVYAPGERINITATFQNTSDGPLSLSLYPGVLKYEITINQQPLEPSLSLDRSYEAFTSSVARNFQRLEPGEQITMEVPNIPSLEGNELQEFRPSPGDQFGTMSRAFSLQALGEYTIIVTYELTLEDMGEFGDDLLASFPDVFIGSATSQPLSFRLQ